jgi:hypothetical protein
MDGSPVCLDNNTSSNRFDIFQSETRTMESTQSMVEPEETPRKVCFVTTGATAPFTALIEAVLSPSSLDAFTDAGYSDLYIQFGSANDVYKKHQQAAVSRLEAESKAERLTIGGTGFFPDGLKEQFRMVQDSNGLVISHAGMHLHESTSSPAAD